MVFYIMGAPLNGVLYNGAPLNGVLYSGAPLNGFGPLPRWRGEPCAHDALDPQHASAAEGQCTTATTLAAGKPATGSDARAAPDRRGR